MPSKTMCTDNRDSPGVGRGLSVIVFPSQGALSPHSSQPAHTVIWIASEFIPSHGGSMELPWGWWEAEEQICGCFILKKDTMAAT